MAWIKVPVENFPLFHAALPRDPRISTIQMFGSVAATVNGNMFGGLFARSAMVKLSDEDLRDALALDGAEPFDPMGTGRVMTNAVLLPETILDDPDQLARWLRMAFDYAVTLPPKKKKGAGNVTKRAARPAAPPRRPGKAAKAGAATARVSTSKGSRRRGVR